MGRLTKAEKEQLIIAMLQKTPRLLHKDMKETVGNIGLKGLLLDMVKRGILQADHIDKVTAVHMENPHLYSWYWLNSNVPANELEGK